MSELPATEPSTRPDPPWGAEDSAISLERIATSFSAAKSAYGSTVERDFAIAGHRMRLRAADADLVRRMSRSFAHLETAPANAPELTVHLWDSASAGTPPPPIPDVHGEQAPGAFFYYSDPRIRVGFQLGTSGDARVFGVYPHEPTPALSVLDSERAEAWFWVADARRIPYWELANPVRYLLDWWLRDRGVHQVHAGAVGTPEGGVLLVGKSGSGKSTATLSTLQSGLGYAGDDFVAVTLEPEPWVHSLYSSGKLMADHVVHLPFLLPGLANSEELEREKAVVYVHEHWPKRIATQFPLRAILAARVVPGLVDARVVEVPPAVGLAALAPSTVFQMHTRGQDSLARMRRLVQVVPSFVLELGSDIPSIPTAISDLLERLSAKHER